MRLTRKALALETKTPSTSTITNDWRGVSVQTFFVAIVILDPSAMLSPQFRKSSCATHQVTFSVIGIAIFKRNNNYYISSNSSQDPKSKREQ
jgi:hypothetical protein